MIRKSIFFTILFTLAFSYSCTWENIEEYYSTEFCDTLNVTYTETVAPILDRNCLGCHFSGNGSGVDLDTYQGVKKHIENGSLLGSIKHETGYSPMPKNGNRLDECTIAKIEQWIDDGYLNN